MSPLGPPQLHAAEIEASLLAVLVDAETTREGAAALLELLAPVIDESDPPTMALAARDRDGVRLQTLSERGEPREWPTALDPRFSISGNAGVDSRTGAFVFPLRANGRVIGALMLGDSARGSTMLQDGASMPILATVATVLDALLRRTDAVVTRRAKMLRSVESVLDGLAHQIANPLTGASAIAQLLEADLQDEGQRAAVRQMRQELSRAFAVLNDMLSFQHETGAHAGVLDLNSIAEGMARLRGYAIREQGIALEVETLASPASVRVDARAVEHAMLLALRFAEVQSRGSVNRSISLRVVERGPSELAVDITDSGPGNTPQPIATYFDLRFRDDDPRAVLHDPPDLGLADSLLRAAGGRLDVRASKSEGTTLSVVLPRLAPGAHAAQSQLP